MEKKTSIFQQKNGTSLSQLCPAGHTHSFEQCEKLNTNRPVKKTRKMFVYVRALYKEHRRNEVGGSWQTNDNTLQQQQQQTMDVWVRGGLQTFVN